jgi:hypothetical protein
MNGYLRERYGERVQKIMVDAGFTCPNRDGTKAVGGCIYCNNDSFNFSPDATVEDQLARGIERAKIRYGARKYIAYFQTYTNTYADPDVLRKHYSAVHQFPDIVGLSIGTRPDCVPENVLRVIESFAGTHEVWVEYGLESSNDESLRRMNRAHTFADFQDAVLRSQGRGLKIAAHIIVGLPWETKEMMLQTAKDVAALPLDGIKIHSLHVVKGTALAQIHERAPLRLLSLREYAVLAAQMLELLPPEMVIHRLSAECPDELLIAPDWTNYKSEILSAITAELSSRDSFQGRLYSA